MFALAVASAAAVLALVWSPFAVLLPVSQFGGLAWLAYVGFALLKARHTTADAMARRTTADAMARRTTADTR